MSGAPRKRGRPRLHPPKQTAPLTAAQRSELGRATWKNRAAPDYRRHTKSICVAAEVVDHLSAVKGEKTWTEFFCERFGITPPVDRRRRL